MTLPNSLVPQRFFREGERWERRQRRKQRPERVAAVGTKQALSVASAGNRNRTKTLPYEKPVVKLFAKSEFTACIKIIAGSMNASGVCYF